MKEMICRLCLQTICNNNYQPVEESLLKSLKLNINISKENVMCIECAHRLRVFSNFTPGCAFTEEETMPLSDLDNGIKLDPEAIESTTNLKSLVEMEIKCSFCTKAHGRRDLISLWELKENKFMVNMLERYILEMNLKSTEELLVCKICFGSLEDVSSVILKGLEVEEKISKYIELEGMDDKGQVELKKVQQFTFKPILKSEIEMFGVNELGDRSYQVEEEYTMMAKAEIKCEKEISNTELIIKTEADDIQSDRDILIIKSEESDCNGFQFIENKSPSEIKKFQCEFCSFHAKFKHLLKRHLLTHANGSEIEMFKCELCPLETRYKSSLKTHLLMTHKSPSEIKMFKCELCSFETKRKSSLKAHLLIHTSPSEIQMFKCDICSYEAKQKSSLISHSLSHRNPSEIEMFKCEICSYETKHKTALKRHLLIHKSSSEINMFKCELCSYEAKLKNHLKSHLLTHKSRFEIKMFKCELCSFETKRKSGLKAHLPTHKSPSEIKMFQCKLCSYKVKRRNRFQLHLLTHENPSEIKMFKCELCSFETKRRCSLGTHLLTHRSPSEMKMFKCEICPYEVTRKRYIERHLLTHKKGI